MSGWTGGFKTLNIIKFLCDNDNKFISEMYMFNNLIELHNNLQYIMYKSEGAAYVTNLGGNMARFTQFPLMITRLTIIYEIFSPGAAGSSIYV